MPSRASVYSSVRWVVWGPRDDAHERVVPTRNGSTEGRGCVILGEIPWLGLPYPEIWCISCLTNL